MDFSPHDIELWSVSRIFIRVLLRLLAVVSIVGNAQGQTVFQQNANGQPFDYTKSGGGKGFFPNNSNWSQVQQLDVAGNIIAPSNWSVSTGVTSGADVIINGNFTSDDADYAISSLTLLNGGEVDLNDGITIAISGGVTNNGAIDIPAGSTFSVGGTASNTGWITITGDVTFGGVSNIGAIAGSNFLGGTMSFSGSSNAGSASITNNGATALGNGGDTEFNDSSSAGNATFTNMGGTALGDPGGTFFSDTSTAGTATFNNYGGVTYFSGSSTAGHGTFTNSGDGGYMQFVGNSTAGNGKFTNNGGTVSGNSGGQTFFGGNAVGTNEFATAGSGTFTNNGGTVNGADGGYTEFDLSATAGNGIFINSGATVSGAYGGYMIFNDSSTVGSATLIANSGTGGGHGGDIVIASTATGGTAAVKVYGNGIFDGTSGQLDIDENATIGSLEGSGVVFLNASNLTVGSNNASTTFSGTMSDFGTGGSLTVTSGGIFANSGSITLTGAPPISTPNGGTFAQKPAGTLNIQIVGPGDGEHGQIVAGTAVLSGKLNISFPTGYKPGYNDSYKILSTNSLSGTFNNGDPLLQVGLRFFRIDYADDGVTIQPTSIVTFYHEPENGYVVGHAFLSTTSISGVTAYYGFYPAASPIYGPGGVENDRYTPWDFAIVYPVTKNQYQTLARTIVQDLASPPIYFIVGFNCMTWVAKIANSAGIQLPAYTNPVTNTADERIFGGLLASFGSGFIYNTGVVINGGFVFPQTTGQTPYDYSYAGVENAGHSDPSSLACSTGLAYDAVNLGTVNANITNGLTMSVAGTTTSTALISINWGDGSAFQRQSLAFSHVYAPGTYTAQLLVVDNGAVHSYTMTVVVSASAASAVTVNVTPFQSVDTPNPGLTPADLVPDFLVVACKAISIATNGHAIIQFSGIPTWTYTIEATSNLTQSFVPVGSGVAGSEGTFQYEDPQTSSFSRRFYRATYP